METMDDLPECPVPPVPKVSRVSYNEELGKHILNNEGYKGYLGYRILTTGESISRQGLAERYNISINTVKKTILDNPLLFEVKGTGEGGELIGLSNQGARYIKEIIENYENSKMPSLFEKRRELNLSLKERVVDYLTGQLNFKKYFKEFSSINNKDFVEFDFNDIAQIDPALSESLLNNPEDTIDLMYDVIKEKFDSQKEISFDNFPDSIFIEIGSIRAKHQKQLCKIEGNIILKSKTEPRIMATTYECPACGSIIKIKQTEEKEREGLRCSCGRKGRFTKICDEDTDEQILILEEPLDVVNRDVQTIPVILRGFLTSPNYDSIKNIGERVIVAGIVDSEQKSLKQGKSTHKTKLIRAITLKPSKSALTDLHLTEDDLRKIEDYSMNENLALKIGEEVFPNIEGYSEVKEAIILQQVGGVRKILPDKNVRGDIHILLIGDPATAKSDFLVGTMKISPKCRFISGQGTSKVGLIGNVRYDDLLKAWTVEGGALAKANKGIVLADELDKMNEDDRAGLHTAMEQQIVTIDKASIHATLITQTAVLASANPKYSHWDLNNDLLEQFNLPSSLKGRNDLIFPMKDIHNESKDTKIASKMLNPKKENVDYDFYRKYLYYAKNLKPELTESAKTSIKNVYVELRKINKREIITARDINALIRLSEAYAKLRLSNRVEDDDVKNAIRLHRFCLNELRVFDNDVGLIERRWIGK